MLHQRVFIACLTVTFLTPGCQKKKETPGPAPVAQGKSVSMEDSTAPPPPPPPPPVNPDGSAPAPANAAADNPEAFRQQEILRLKPPQGDGEIPSQKAIIWAVDRWEERNPVLPKDVNELVAKGLLKPLPPPPAGKKYFLDAHNRTLTVVDK